jgi:hypothetical protein
MAGYMDPDAPGDALRQNKLDPWRPMLGTAIPNMADPAGGVGPEGTSGIIFAAVDAAPLDNLDPLDESPTTPRVEAPIRFARKGSDAAAKKGDVQLSYDLSAEDPSVYATLFDVDDAYPEAQVWRNTHWDPEVVGQARVPRAPLPIPANAGALGATTVGELAALALRKIPRVWFTTFNDQNWQEMDVDGRHVIFPRRTYPVGDGPMAPQGSMKSVVAAIPNPITSELGLPSGASEDYSALVGA